jgi:preprotein translocase subunit SecY
VGLFSLGIIPYINASIVLQLMSAAFPALKKMQREDGPQGRARFQYYQKLAAFVFAIAQVRQHSCMVFLVCRPCFHHHWHTRVILSGS